MQRVADKARAHFWQALLVLIVLGAGLLGTIGLGLLRQQPKKQHPLWLGPVVKVHVAKSQNVPVLVHGFGTVQPRVSVQIVPQVEGRIVQVHPSLRAGGFFTAKDVLIRIDPTDYELTVQQAKADLAQAKAALDSAVARIGDFQARREDAQLEMTRLRKLYEHKSATRRELDKAELAIKQAESQLTAVWATKAQTAAARATAKTKLEITRLKLARTQILVPFDGRVVSEQVDVGQFVARGQTLAEVYGTDSMEIVVPLETSKLAWFDIPSDPAANQTLRTTTAIRAEFAGAQRSWQGHVARLEGRVDSRSRMVNIVVEVPDPFTQDTDTVPLMPGMFVQVQIHGKTIRDVMVIPRHALRLDGQVWIAERGALRFMPVQVVRHERDAVYVRGLEEGQLVITSALDVVTNGMQIRIEQQPKPMESPRASGASANQHKAYPVTHDPSAQAPFTVTHEAADE